MNEREEEEEEEETRLVVEWSEDVRRVKMEGKLERAKQAREGQRGNKTRWWGRETRVMETIIQAKQSSVSISFPLLFGPRHSATAVYITIYHSLLYVSDLSLRLC